MDVLIDYIFDSTGSKGQTAGIYENSGETHSLRFIADEADLTLDFSEDQICISRRGPISYRIPLMLGKTNLTVLQTPLGKIECQASLTKLIHHIEEGTGKIEFEYTLGQPYEALSHRMQLCISKKK